ncbi:MAG: hypothetical protein SGPRY_010588 [Prymnesium sp.]
MVVHCTNSDRSLQQRFEKMRSRRVAGSLRLHAAQAALLAPRSMEAKAILRAKFTHAVHAYLHTPYSKSSAPEAPLHLDCCGLVKRALRDLKGEFGFEVGPWNQSYLFDTLRPGQCEEEQMLPGDLIFWTASFVDPERPRAKHGIVHVEVRPSRRARCSR